MIIEHIELNEYVIIVCVIAYTCVRLFARR